MRIAKGGSGKSTIAGALSPHLGRRGHSVVAIDADPNPNRGIALGLERAAVETMTPILNALLATGITHDDPPPPARELLDR